MDNLNTSSDAATKFGRLGSSPDRQQGKSSGCGDEIFTPFSLDEMVTIYMRDEEGKLLDAVVTAAALVAGAGGYATLREKNKLMDFLHRNHFLAIFEAGEIIEAFHSRCRDVSENHNNSAIMARLIFFSDRPAARVIIGAAKAVADANGASHPKTRAIMLVIDSALVSHKCSEP